MWSGRGWGMASPTEGPSTWDGVPRTLTIEEATPPELTRSWFRWFLEADGCRTDCGVSTGGRGQVHVPGSRQLVERRRRETEQARLASLRAGVQPAVEAAVQWNVHVRQTLDKGRLRGRWIAREEVARLARRRPRDDLGKTLSSHPELLDLLTGKQQEALKLLNRNLPHEVAQVNEQIFRRELTLRADFFQNVEDLAADRGAGARGGGMDNRVQVVAAAGSGKTSVMVARAAYRDRPRVRPRRADPAARLQQGCGRRAPATVDSRLRALGLDPSGVRASTFHAFGLDDHRPSHEREAAARRVARTMDAIVEMVSRIVDELRDRSPDFRFRWDVFRLLFARTAERAPTAASPTTTTEPIRRLVTARCNGETVKSQGERMIADWLFLNGVNYVYERPTLTTSPTHTTRSTAPTSTTPTLDVWHEHWALDSRRQAAGRVHGLRGGHGVEEGRAPDARHHLIETTWAEIMDQSRVPPLARATFDAHGPALDWNPDRPVPARAR